MSWAQRAHTGLSLIPAARRTPLGRHSSCMSTAAERKSASRSSQDRKVCTSFLCIAPVWWCGVLYLCVFLLVFFTACLCFVGTRWRPVVVTLPTRTLYWTFEANHAFGGNPHSWGWLFQVQPLQGQSWVSETAALSGAPSLDWACWLLELLLAQGRGLGAGAAVQT